MHQINQNTIINKLVNPMPSLNHSGYRVGQISNKKQLTKTNANKIYIKRNTTNAAVTPTDASISVFMHNS